MKQGRINLIYIAVIALSLTNFSVATIYTTFNVMVFWPVLAIVILFNIEIKGFQLPNKSILFFGLVLTMAISVLANRSASMVSTTIYSLAWIIYWLWLLSVKGSVNPRGVRKTLEFVVWIYFCLIAISFLLVLAGVSESPAPEILGWTPSGSSWLPRFYGPTTEPSYAALILGASWLGARRIPVAKDKKTRAKERRLLFALFISLLALQSIYGILVAALVVSTLISGNNPRAQRVWYLGLAIFSLPFILALVPSDTRLGNIIEQLSSFNLAQLRLSDNSSYMRIGPMYELISNSSLFSVPFWLGHGAGEAGLYFGNVFGYAVSDTVFSIDLGFFPAFIYDFGILPTVVTITYLMFICAGPFKTQSRLLFILALFDCNFNTQLFWYIATCMFLSLPLAVSRARGADTRFGSGAAAVTGQ